MYDADEDDMDLDEEWDSQAKIFRSNDQESSTQLEGQDDLATELLSKTPTKSSSHQATPIALASRTPSKGKEQDHLRQRELEIEAMHKKIAEYEKRQKEKLAASRTQSPGTQPCPVPSLVQAPTSSTSPVHPQERPSSPRDKGAESSPQAPSYINPVIADLPRSSPARTRASLDPANINDMKKKFLRKKEIESGLPLLEAELVKSEQRLAEYRKQEQELLAEINKGKEGKRQLIAELESLGIETEGLSMAELQATKDNLIDNGDMDSPPSKSSSREIPCHVNLSPRDETSLEFRNSHLGHRPHQFQPNRYTIPLPTMKY